MLFATFLLHNAVLHRKLVPTDRSMVYLPCLHLTGHIPFASGANINICFVLHNAVFHRKLVPTDRSMVYLPCLHVTGYIPFASRANVSIRFCNDLCVPDLEKVTACASVICLARAYTAPHKLSLYTYRLKRDKHIGNSCPSSLLLLPLPAASPSPPRWRRSAVCSSFLHACLHACLSVVFSTLLCVRRCFVPLSAILFTFSFSFRDGSPDISDDARFFFFFCNFPCYLRLRCSYPFRRFPDDPSGQHASAAVVADLITIKRTMRHPRLISERWLLYLAQAAAPAAPRLAWTI